MEEMGHERPTKRKRLSGDVNWTDEEELERMLEKKRRLEAKEPYNTTEARQRAKEVGKEGARRSSWSDISRVSKNVTPRGLSIEGDSSSEFMSAKEGEDTGIGQGDGGKEHAHKDAVVVSDVANTPLAAAMDEWRQRRKERKKAKRKKERATDSTHQQVLIVQQLNAHGQDEIEHDESPGIAPLKSKRSRRRSRAARRRRELAAVAAATVAVHGQKDCGGLNGVDG